MKHEAVLRRRIKAMPCLFANCGCLGPIDPCHIKSFGSTGIDAEWNIIPLCRRHHDQQHQIGWQRMMNLHPRLIKIFKVLGWSWETVNGKFVMYHDQLREKYEGQN